MARIYSIHASPSVFSADDYNSKLQDIVKVSFTCAHRLVQKSILIKTLDEQDFNIGSEGFLRVEEIFSVASGIAR